MSGSGTGSSARGSARGYIHDALLYDSVDELTGTAVPFLLEGLAAGEAAVIAAGARTAGVLAEAVDGDPRVHVLERSDVYRTRTPAAITAFRRLAERCVAEGIGRIRVVGEVDFGPTERDWLEWQRYEAVINVALADWPLWGLCVFDTQRLPSRSSRPRCARIRTWSPPSAADPTRSSVTRSVICARCRYRRSRWRTRHLGWPR